MSSFKVEEIGRSTVSNLLAFGHGQVVVEVSNKETGEKHFMTAMNGTDEDVRQQIGEKIANGQFD